ncbi:DNA-3-methyladenine glycosylase I [Lactobacillus sanfranciscensis]|nr:DNA-3-methyladenine glycosylase I [Fructilactobacillus sanfranciscensis]MCG7196184.1 DNA-3-methyladenine glycosylase I [Fructilactobacillus sanfranciscensis]NDR75524.1 DNA-3-methyladenine glycosylase I [Fructilactobacillus sanfranciscensis]NDR96281.1 DNA-3-methyladenine glycosylase I [Fructilactobacillus sanfranciscensis]NDS04058.1 DNA-3-methyladenine glycosylase I [Fructilactobacillus sanfranciscensis]POH19117.1 3-methyladenine DNA glycosylase [Fructilactobacillus sanfranciscensis]
MENKQKHRCSWANTDDKLMQQYHDEQWGKPIYDDQEMFELLSLELMHSGLSWKTVLHKQTNFEKAFHNFDYHQVAQMEPEIADLLNNAGIIRNNRKINAIITNAKVIEKLHEQGSSFSELMWNFVAHKPIINSINNHNDIPSTTPLATTISKKLKSIGFSFTGPVVVYSFMQSCGMVNDHENNCFAK